MEDILMKFIRITLISTCFLVMLLIFGADEKQVEKGHFLSINPNINNEELKSELQVLKQKFDFEQQNIQNYYTKEIERLKEARRMEVKSLKKTFAEKRGVLLEKYGN